MLEPRIARSVLESCNALDVPFHALPSRNVAALLAWANYYKYREPKNANGSRARYYHAYLVRRAEPLNTKESTPCP